MASNISNDKEVALSYGSNPSKLSDKELSASSDKSAIVEPSDVGGTEVSKNENNLSVEDEENEYPHGLRLALIMTALCLAIFCFSLDNTIIATAIPRITDDFKALDDVGWYASAYLLAGCAPQLIYGKLYTLYNVKWVYLVAIFIFELGSLICGVAPTSTALIIGRAIAGVGGAGIYTGSMLIISKTVPLRLRASYTSMTGAMYCVAFTIAPLLGGALTDNVSWRWCFYINLPLGGVTVAFILFFYETPKNASGPRIGWKEQLGSFDLLGTSLFVPAIVCLLLALQWGGTTYHWSNGRIVALFVLAGILLIAFAVVQVWKQETATVPPRIFKNRNVWGSIIFNIPLAAAYFVMVYFTPIWFQAIKGVSATKSGIMNLPMVIGGVVFVLISGAAITAIGYYGPFMLFCSVASAIGAGLMTTFEVDTAHPAWIGYQALFGMGVGSGMQVTLVTVQAALPPADIPIATALMIFSQTLGGSLFVSVAQNVFTNLLVKNLIKNVPNVVPSIVQSTGATELKNVIDPAYLPQVLVAYSDALTRTWYSAVALAAVSIFGVAVIDWRISVKEKKVDVSSAI